MLAREAPILRRQGVEWTDTSRRGGIKVKTLTYRAPEDENRPEPNAGEGRQEGRAP